MRITQFTRCSNKINTGCDNHFNTPHRCIACESRLIIHNATLSDKALRVYAHSVFKVCRHMLSIRIRLSAETWASPLTHCLINAGVHSTLTRRWHISLCLQRWFQILVDFKPELDAIVLLPGRINPWVAAVKSKPHT